MNNENKKKKRLVIIFIAPAIALTLLFFALKISFEPEAIHNSTEKNMNNETAFSFNKEGELNFLSKEGKIISAINIEIADNDEKHAMGLMYRTRLDENQAMLFIFTTAEEHSFWMKNTHLPLDIIFVNAGKEIIKIHKNTVPFQGKPDYESGKPALYVVETNAGYCDKYNVKEGDKIIYTRL
jgi:uncharacterized protein